LRRNVARNDLSNVTVIEKGVWSCTGQRKFVVADTASPDRGTGRFVTEDTEDAVLLNCVALDNFAEEHPAPQAIKCDVEGAEVEVLRGAQNLIRLQRPWILAEMHSDATARDWHEFLTRCGYKLERVDTNHVIALP
jgi:FkbM family methyltransferase